MIYRRSGGVAMSVFALPALFACGRPTASSPLRASLEVRDLAPADSLMEQGSNKVVRIKSLLGPLGAAIILLDAKACESCLNIDTELRALRQAWPNLPVHLVAQSSNARLVREYLNSGRTHEIVFVPFAGSALASVKDAIGALTVHLVGADGRILFTQIRYPGSRQQLIIEDLNALRALTNQGTAP